MDSPYVKVKNGQSQYADIDLRMHKAVQARYVRTRGFEGKPYVEALPNIQHVSVNNESVMQSAMELQYMSQRQRDMAISRINDFRAILPFYDDLAYEVRRTMLEAYSASDSTFRDRKRIARSRGKEKNGFALLGISGSGKTCSINATLEQYPQTIVHHINGDVRIQIPYLYIPGTRYSSLHELYKSIGQAVDLALDNGNHSYEEGIDNLHNHKKERVCIARLLKNYHVGIVVLDEVQNLVSVRGNERPLDTMLSVCNESKTGIGLVGAEDAFYELFGMGESARITDLIVASNYCQNYKETDRIVKELFSLGYIDNFEPSKEIVSLFEDICGGIVEYLVRLYYYIVKEYVTNRKKSVDEAYVQKIADRDLRIFQKSVDRLLTSTDLEQIQRRSVLSDMREYARKQNKRSSVICDVVSKLPYEKISGDKGAIMPKKESETPINTEAVLYKLLASERDDDEDEEH